MQLSPMIMGYVAVGAGPAVVRECLLSIITTKIIVKILVIIYNNSSNYSNNHNFNNDNNNNNYKYNKIIIMYLVMIVIIINTAYTSADRYTHNFVHAGGKPRQYGIWPGRFSSILLPSLLALQYFRYRCQACFRF